MHKVTVFEKVLGEIVENTYAFPRKDQMLQFKRMCEEDGALVIIHKHICSTLAV